MTLLAQQVMIQEPPSPNLINLAKELVAKYLIPPRLTRNVILTYVVRARRNGTWRYLSKEVKALLTVASKVIKEVKSPILKKVIKEALLTIELMTLRGKALLQGILTTLKNPILKVKEIIRDKTKLLLIGIMQLNNPPIYRYLSS